MKFRYFAPNSADCSVLLPPDGTIVSAFCRGITCDLFFKQAKSLQEFCINEAKWYEDDDPPECDMELCSLELRSNFSYFATDLLEPGRKSLHQLKLGEERLVAEAYARTEAFPVPGPGHSLRNFLFMDDLGNGPTFTSLRCLELVGLKISDGDEAAVWELFDVTGLERLVLESCSGCEGVLVRLSGGNRKAQPANTTSERPSKLKEFVFRYEAPTKDLKKGLKDFLTSFSGLELLSVMLENTKVMMSPDCFIPRHGKSLKVLTWEGRTKPRISREEGTSISMDKASSKSETSIDKIFAGCPNLVELSIPLDWSDVLPFQLVCLLLKVV